ncbi:HAMP domain-containing sensor histidine kinase [Enterococcus asini]|uniref:histidine kinase n=1 Tax=Enterococcus asini TaxID=57732 RepID=A0AAW8TYD5_9ENTE|nr:HAMP domain-containing sensor histidine kinase [Enterococcus asini]MDT2810466.1 HAMP domain-containing sensor histidine kinase [Enterococcus asini]
MKKIANRLILQSVSLLLFFALIIAILFGVLFSRHTEELHQEELVHRSELISDTLADYFKTDTSSTSQSHGQNNGQGGYGAFLRFMNQIAGEAVWVVDEALQPVISDHHQDGTTNTPLPEQVQALVRQTYQNKETNVTKDYQFLQLNELTVVTPILSGQQVLAVVVMHSQVNAIHKNQLSGYVMLLLSLLVSVLLASLLAWRLAKRFVRPIAEMRAYVDDLAHERFETQLKIHTHDELQELGDQLTLLSQRLADAQEARKKKAQSEKDFLSQISHELRTPVMVIKSSLEAMEEGYLNDQEEKDYRRQLLIEVTSLERLVNDLLELSRLESTEFHLQKEPLDLLDCLNDALRSYRIPFKEKQQTLQFTNHLAQKKLMNGDYQRITQMLKIILDNAQKYSPEKAVIQLNLGMSGEDLEIILTNPLLDSGLDTQQLFDSFQRGRNPGQNGTGLGLAIAKQVVLRHQGVIEAQTPLGQFVIRIQFPTL